MNCADGSGQTLAILSSQFGNVDRLQRAHGTIDTHGALSPERFLPRWMVRIDGGKNQEGRATQFVAVEFTERQRSGRPRTEKNHGGRTHTIHSGDQGITTVMANGRGHGRLRGAHDAMGLRCRASDGIPPSRCGFVVQRERYGPPLTVGSTTETPRHRRN